MGQATAKMNITDLRKVLGLSEASSEESSKSPEASDPSANPSPTTPITTTGHQVSIEQNRSDSTASEGSTAPSQNHSQGSRVYRVRRESMEQLNLIKVGAVFMFNRVTEYFQSVRTFSILYYILYSLLVTSD